jgi:DNA (cytosine-5)-methyltransferase 1
MTAYYNEIDPKASAWLRELIKQGHIADGVVDERSIIDVTPDELRGFTQCHFFAGIGVWSYALRAAGWADDRPVWTGSCPCQPFSTAGRRGGVDDERHLWPHWHHLISQCQPAIVFGEQVASKDGLGWLDLVSTDMEATGYAFGAADLCAAGIGAPHIRQRLFFGSVRLADTSNAGSQGRLRGRADEGWEDQHGHAGRDFAVGGRGGLADAESGWRWGGLIQADGNQGEHRAGSGAGGLANTAGSRQLQRGLRNGGEFQQGTSETQGEGCQQADGPVGYCEDVDMAQRHIPSGPTNGFWRDADWLFCRDGKWRAVEPSTFPLADGASARVGRLRGYGNAIVAQVAQTFIESMMEITA